MLKVFLIFFRCLSLDHVGYGLAGKVEEGLDVEVVSGEDEFEECGLVYIAELFVHGRCRRFFSRPSSRQRVGQGWRDGISPIRSPS